MELLTRREFAESMNKKSNWLNVYIKRGLVVLTDNKIDPTHPQNRDFFEVHTNPTSPLDLRRHKKSKYDDSSTEPTSTFNLDTQLKMMDVQKKQREVALLEIKRQKLEGEVIPTDLVVGIISRVGKANTTAFSQALENFILSAKQKYKLPSEAAAEMRKAVLATTNKAITNATKEALGDVQAIVDEYSAKISSGGRV